MNGEKENSNLSMDTIDRTQTTEFNDARTCQTQTLPKPKNKRFPRIFIDIKEEIRLLKESIESEKKKRELEAEKENVEPLENSDDVSDLDKKEEFATPLKKQTNETKQPASLVKCGTQPKIQYSTNVDSYNTPLKPLFKTPTTSSAQTKRVYASKFQPLYEDDKKDVDFNKIIVKNTRYLVLNVLGRGGSSIVYNCYLPETKVLCAIKCVDLNQDASVVKGFINEVKTLEKLKKCEKIIQLHTYEVIKEEKKLYMVLEKGGKDLSQILKDLDRSSNHLPMYKVLYYWMEMLHAVKEIHSHGVIHSDLKPANFLQVEGNIKLIDFGIATCIQKEMTSVVKNIAMGTFNYISPEALRNDASNDFDLQGKPKYLISYKSDVWSLGCILYQLVYRRTPFQHIGNTSAKISVIIDPNHKIDYPVADWVSEKILGTIRRCLLYDMRSRPSIDELLMEKLCL